MCRYFSGKARGYILTYQHTTMKQEDTVNENKCEVNEKINFLYECKERIHNAYQSHCDANIIDDMFIIVQFYIMKIQQ